MIPNPAAQQMNEPVRKVEEKVQVLHLYAIHVIFVIQLDKGIIFINLSNQTCVLPPAPAPE